MPLEQGPIRPPSEVGSLMPRFTRNRPWNRCSFRPIHTGLGSDVSFSKAGKMPALPGKSAHEMKLFTLNRYNSIVGDV